MQPRQARGAARRSSRRVPSATPSALQPTCIDRGGSTDRPLRPSIGGSTATPFKAWRWPISTCRPWARSPTGITRWGRSAAFGPLPDVHTPIAKTPMIPFSKFGMKDHHVRQIFDKLSSPEKRVLVLKAGTGTGKSTFGPFRFLVPPDGVNFSFTEHGPIVVTEPRVQATIGVARYVGERLVMGCPLMECSVHGPFNPKSRPWTIQPLRSGRRALPIRAPGRMSMITQERSRKTRRVPARPGTLPAAGAARCPTVPGTSGRASRSATRWRGDKQPR